MLLPYALYGILYLFIDICLLSFGISEYCLQFVNNTYTFALIQIFTIFAIRIEGQKIDVINEKIV